MKHAVVLGAGIAGISTAWYLASAGMKVTVVDQADQPAAETSHANGGHISTQSGAPWTAPGVVKQYVLSRFRAKPVVKVMPFYEPGQLQWMRLALQASHQHSYDKSAGLISALADYSRSELDALESHLSLDINKDARGVLEIYRTRKAFSKKLLHLTNRTQVLNKKEVIEREPSFANACVDIAGACFYPDDATGDCQSFCTQLAHQAEIIGVEMQFKSLALHIETRNNRISAVTTSRGEIECDLCVVALGSQARSFLIKHGVKVPILPLRGYTLTTEIPAEATVPGRFVDVERRIVFSQLGRYFRAAGMADFSGSRRNIPKRRAALLRAIANDWAPPLRKMTPEFWACLRPMTPDGPPFVGQTHVGGLWVNVGYGSLGWTLGVGGSRLLADKIQGKKPALSIEEFSAQRFTGK